MRNSGLYVEYTHKPYLIVKNAGDYVHLNSPVHGRVKVLKTNVRRLDIPRAPIVEHKGKKYVVTAKGRIFSVLTGKQMKWSDDNGDRRDILKAAGFGKTEAQLQRGVSALAATMAG